MVTLSPISALVSPVEIPTAKAPATATFLPVAPAMASAVSFAPYPSSAFSRDVAVMVTLPGALIVAPSLTVAAVLLLIIPKPTPTPMPILLLGLAAKPLPEVAMPIWLPADTPTAPPTFSVTSPSEADTLSCAAAIPAAAAIVSLDPFDLPSESRCDPLVLSMVVADVDVPPVSAFVFSSAWLNLPPSAVADAVAS